MKNKKTVTVALLGTIVSTVIFFFSTDAIYLMGAVFSGIGVGSLFVASQDNEDDGISLINIFFMSVGAAVSLCILIYSFLEISVVWSKEVMHIAVFTFFTMLPFLGVATCLGYVVLKECLNRQDKNNKNTVCFQDCTCNANDYTDGQKRRVVVGYKVTSYSSGDTIEPLSDRRKEVLMGK